MTLSSPFSSTEGSDISTVGAFGIPADYFGPPDGEIAFQADEMQASRIETQAMAAVRTALHDPQTGFAARPPLERLTALPEIQATLDGIGETFRAQATTPRQRAILDPLLDNHLEHATLQVGRLAHRALAEADDGIVESRIGNLQQDAAVNWDDLSRLRILGRAIVTECRSQGERKGWDKGETETKVRQGASDFYATAIEAAMDRDLDRAGKLLIDAQGVLLPDRQALLARQLAEARDDRHVAGIAGALSALPLDPATPPHPEVYRARAEELTLDDAMPELRARIAILADTTQRHATKYWQHDRNQAGLAAFDWILANPGAPVVTMDRKIASQLSPGQRARLQEIETTGRLDIDPEVYARLDRMAVYDSKTFAATDLSQYRLALDGQDYRRFTAFQKGEATFVRYDRGRTVLDAGLIKAGFDPDGSEARAARGELDKTLCNFEIIEGRPPTMVDIDRVVEAIVPASSTPAPPEGEVMSDASPDAMEDGQKYAQAGPPRPPRRPGGRLVTPIEEVREGNFHSHLNALRSVEPKNSALTYVAPPGWIPEERDVSRVHQELLRARERAASNFEGTSSGASARGIGIGDYAGESIPARSPAQSFRVRERSEINRIGSESGCHTCGTANPGTSLGNFVPDHQPPSALNSSGSSQRLFPHCLSCSSRQGYEIMRQLKKGQP